MLGTLHNRYGMNEHEHGEDDEVQAGEGFGQPFVVAGQASESIEPAEATLPSRAKRPQSPSGLIILYEAPGVQRTRRFQIFPMLGD